MTITNGYATLDEIKAYLKIKTGDMADDALLESKVEAASRMIDDFCGRRFYVSPEPETRTFRGEWSDLLVVFDLVSITTFKTDADGDRTYETTWAATDYDLEPENAAADGKPYTKVRLAPNGRYGFPKGAKTVQIVGLFGYPAVPAPVKDACLIQASRLFRRKDAIFGVVGSAEMGQQLVIPTLDPDVKILLKPYVRLTDAVLG